MMAVGTFAILCAAGSANATDVHVLASTALKPLFEKVAPEFEAMNGDRLVFSWGASYGDSPDALPVRLGAGERADLIVMIREALDEQIKQGHVRPTTLQDLATSRIGLAVPAGASRPDISSIEALRHTLLTARSVAYSSGVSGIYLATDLFPKLEITEQLKPKSIVVAAPELVGHILLRGEAEIGLQQMSELLAVPGIEVVGTLPDAAQRVNIIAAAITTNAQHHERAEELISFLRGSRAAQALEEAGFSPMGL